MAKGISSVLSIPIEKTGLLLYQYNYCTSQSDKYCVKYLNATCQSKYVNVDQSKQVSKGFFYF